MEKFVYYNELFLIYRDFLSTNSQEIFDLYYGDNLSMQEIADLKRVSKSRIGVIIKQTEKKLDSLEEKCKLFKINNKLTNLLDYNDVDSIKKDITNILKGEL